MEKSFEELSTLCLYEWLHRKLGFVVYSFRHKDSFTYDVVSDILWDQGIQSTDKIYETLFAKLEEDLKQKLFKMKHAEGLRKEYLDGYLKEITDKCLEFEVD